MALKAKAKSTFETNSAPEPEAVQVNSTKHGHDTAKTPKKEPMKNVRFDDVVVKTEKIDEITSASVTSDPSQDETIQVDKISDEAMIQALDEAENKQLCSGQEMDTMHPSKPDHNQVLTSSMDCEIDSIQETNNEDQQSEDTRDDHKNGTNDNTVSGESSANDKKNGRPCKQVER